MNQLKKLTKWIPTIALLVIYVICYFYYSHTKGLFDSFDLEFDLAGLKDSASGPLREYLTKAASCQAWTMAIISTLTLGVVQAHQCCSSSTCSKAS